MSNELMPGEALVMKERQHWVVMIKPLLLPIALVILGRLLGAFRRVILDTGVVSRASKVIALDRVQDIATNQSLLGRMLGYGRIEIDSAGAAGAEVLSALPHPQRFRDEVFSRAEKLRGTGASEPTAAAPPSV